MITLPRGNSLVLTAVINNTDGTPHILSPTEKVVFTVKRSSEKSEQPIMQQLLTVDNYNDNGELVIKIAPEDTINLRTGDYKFDLAVLVDGIDVYTVVCCDTLRITAALGDKEAFYG